MTDHLNEAHELSYHYHHHHHHDTPELPTQVKDELPALETVYSDSELPEYPSSQSHSSHPPPPSSSLQPSYGERRIPLYYSPRIHEDSTDGHVTVPTTCCGSSPPPPIVDSVTIPPSSLALPHPTTIVIHTPPHNSSLTTLPQHHHHPHPPSSSDLTSPSTRWIYQSTLAQHHQQPPTILDLTKRSISAKSLRLGVPPYTASILEELRCNAECLGRHGLPGFLEVLGSLFPSLKHLWLGLGCEDSHKERKVVVEGDMAKDGSPSGSVETVAKGKDGTQLEYVQTLPHHGLEYSKDTLDLEHTPDESPQYEPEEGIVYDEHGHVVPNSSFSQPTTPTYDSRRFPSTPTLFHGSCSSSMLHALSSTTFNHLHHHPPDRMQRLYILYRLPDLDSIDGVEVTEEERSLARPKTPTGYRVRSKDWLTSATVTETNTETEMELEMELERADGDGGEEVDLGDDVEEGTPNEEPVTGDDGTESYEIQLQNVETDVIDICEPYPPTYSPSPSDSRVEVIRRSASKTSSYRRLITDVIDICDTTTTTAEYPPTDSPSPSDSRVEVIRRSASKTRSRLVVSISKSRACAEVTPVDVALFPSQPHETPTVVDGSVPQSKPDRPDRIETPTKSNRPSPTLGSGGVGSTPKRSPRDRVDASHSMNREDTVHEIPFGLFPATYHSVRTPTKKSNRESTTVGAGDKGFGTAMSPRNRRTMTITQDGARTPTKSVYDTKTTMSPRNRRTMTTAQDGVRTPTKLAYDTKTTMSPRNRRTMTITQNGAKTPTKSAYDTKTHGISEKGSNSKKSPQLRQDNSVRTPTKSAFESRTYGTCDEGSSTTMSPRNRRIMTTTQDGAKTPTKSVYDTKTHSTSEKGSNSKKSPQLRQDDSNSIPKDGTMRDTTFGLFPHTGRAIVFSDLSLSKDASMPQTNKVDLDTIKELKKHTAPSFNPTEDSVLHNSNDSVDMHCLSTCAYIDGTAACPLFTGATSPTPLSTPNASPSSSTSHRDDKAKTESFPPTDIVNRQSLQSHKAATVAKTWSTENKLDSFFLAKREKFLAIGNHHSESDVAQHHHPQVAPSEATDIAVSGQVLSQYFQKSSRMSPFSRESRDNVILHLTKPRKLEGTSEKENILPNVELNDRSQFSPLSSLLRNDNRKITKHEKESSRRKGGKKHRSATKAAEGLDIIPTMVKVRLKKDRRRGGLRPPPSPASVIRKFPQPRQKHSKRRFVSPFSKQQKDLQIQITGSVFDQLEEEEGDDCTDVDDDSENSVLDLCSNTVLIRGSD